jgi:hypothetical protein
MPFIENKGQINNDAVRYYAQTFSGAIFITEHGELVYSLPKNGRNDFDEGWVIKESFVDASIAYIRGEDKIKTKVSYFKGNNASQWRTDLPVYNVVNFGEMYSGIVLQLKAYGENIEKRFRVEPGAYPENIRVKIDGIQDLAVNDSGELQVTTGIGQVTFTKPVAYQEYNDEKQYIDVAYVVEGDIYSFKIGRYDETKELVIDPLLASTFIGGTSNDYGHAITLDAESNVYVTGYTLSSNFPTTPGAYDTSYNGDQEVYISKLDSSLTVLLASTYLGGSIRDGCRAITVDGSGHVFVAGWTNSSDFPTTPGAYDTSYNGGDGDTFVSKFDSTLTTLLASTFLGGSIDNDPASCIRTDSDGNVFVAGKAWSSDFPTTPNAFDTSYNGGYSDTWVSRLDSNIIDAQHHSSNLR